MSVAALLQRVSFFSSLAAPQLQALAAAGSTMTLPASQPVFTAGDAADGLYVILEGLVRISNIDDDGHEVELATLEAGGFFGEMALLDGDSRSATAVCQEPCTLFMLGREAFVTLLSQSTPLLIDLLAVLSGRLRHTNDQYLHEIVQREHIRAEMEIARHRSLSQMVAGVAHEINTPLGIINTAADVIVQTLGADVLAILAHDAGTVSVGEDLQEAARLIQANAARAHKLIETFKSLSVQQVQVAREQVDLPTLVEDTVHLFSINARRARLAIDLQLQVHGDERLWDGYPGYLSQILLNLLSNIERYAYPDGVGGKVEISVAMDHEHPPPCFLLTVRDVGRGIPADDLARVTEPFFTTGRNKGGTGLGMAIVHNLVTSALHGTLHIASQPGAGTTVTLRFPQVITATEPARAER
jgi:signal transduction histidine kinase